MKRKFLYLLCLALSVFAAHAADSNSEEEKGYSISGVVVDVKTKKPMEGVEIMLSNPFFMLSTDKKGHYRFRGLEPGKFQIRFSAGSYKDNVQVVEITDASILVNIELEHFEHQTQEVTVTAKRSTLNDGKGYMPAIEGTTITKDQKTEVALVASTVGGKAKGNAREVFSSITGITVWESDGAGLQLGIGGRGLSPNRSANFNTRQNGYDISADALGYPESYYSPPTEALDRIEVIRGASSIQYGPQFGGMVNFVMKEGGKEKISLNSRTTVGSFNLINSFTSLGGTNKRWNYYAFYQRKIGDGWRPNSSFDVHTAYGAIKYSNKDKFKWKTEYTFMNYLAKQAGGLTDAQFVMDPRQSNRSRNWFKVNWNLLATTLDWKLGEKTKLNWRSFGLMASRSALGNLQRIDRPDDDSERNYIRGAFNNYGSEVRLLHKYKLIRDHQAFLIGGRVYKGNTHAQQGLADASDQPNFVFKDNLPSLSDYVFPSTNFSLFNTHLFYLGKKFSITPGVRYEFISTNAQGSYQEEVLHPLTGAILFEQSHTEQRASNRSIILYGSGIGYKKSDHQKWYANYTRNFKSINFSDMQIVNPNFKIDTNLVDETGFNFELGTRGNNKSETVGYDVNVFYLYYHNRIGSVLQRDPSDGIVKRWRKNISDSRNIGIETYMEWDILKSIKSKKDVKKKGLVWFANLAMIDAKYINSEESAYEGRKVENVPTFNLKSGLNYKRKNWKFSGQFTYLSKQYTDATNAEEAVSSAIYGLIPSYHVLDISVAYKAKKYFTFESGLNNVLNQMYFTRRAVGYPGPGIIPSEGRSIYLTIQIKL